MLPAGYERASSSVPAHGVVKPDRRLRIAFQNPGGGGALEVIRRPNPSPGFRGSRSGTGFQQRADQDREIVDEPLDPSPRTFRSTHDDTEKRAGTQHYPTLYALAGVRPSEGGDLQDGRALVYTVIPGN